MDNLTFATKVLEHLAWPVVALVIVLYLRSEIRQLLPNVKKLKVGSVEAEFELAVSKLETKAASLPEVPASAVPPDPEDDVVRQLAVYHPRSAILEAWREIEIAANQALAATEPPNASRPRRATEVMKLVAQKEMLPPLSLEMLDSLRVMRNQVAHEHAMEPTQKAAEIYVNTAKHLKAMLGIKAGGG